MIQNVDDETFQGMRLESLKLVNNRLLEMSEKSFRWVNKEKESKNNKNRKERDSSKTNDKMTCSDIRKR